MHHPWDLKKHMQAAIADNGGYVNCHAHIEKAYYITKQELAKSMVDMEIKWRSADVIKRNSDVLAVAERIRTAADMMIDQGCKKMCSFIDAYSATDHRAIDAAVQVKGEYKEKIDLLWATQPLDGLVDKQAIDLYEAITNKADIVGGLPSIDRPHPEKHYDTLFGIAKNQHKPIHVHIDQENNPYEHDTEMLIQQTIKHGYEGRVVAIHALSVSAHRQQYRERIYKGLADAGIAVVVCPSAALAMRQLDEYNAPVHNSIANVPEMLDAGVLVGLGIDNIYDYYQPFVDGDLWIELRMLQEACRFYDFDALVKIATTNGKRILNIK